MSARSRITVSVASGQEAPTGMRPRFERLAGTGEVSLTVLHPDKGDGGGTGRPGPDTLTIRWVQDRA